MFFAAIHIKSQINGGITMEAFDTIINKLKELRNKESEQEKEYRRKFSELAEQGTALQNERKQQVRILNEEFMALHDSIDRDLIIKQAKTLGVDAENITVQYIRGVITAFEFIEIVQKRYNEYKDNDNV